MSTNDITYRSTAHLHASLSAGDCDRESQLQSSRLAVASHERVRRIFFLIILCLSFFAVQQTPGHADGGTWAIQLTATGEAYGSQSFTNDPNGYTGSHFCGHEVPTDIVGISNVNNTEIVGTGSMGCSAFSGNGGEYNEADGHGGAKVKITLTWQPKDNDRNNDPAPHYVLIGYKRAVTAHAYAITEQYGPNSGLAGAQAGAEMQFDGLKSVAEADVEVDFAPGPPGAPPVVDEEDDPEGVSDAKFTYELLQVVDGQATKEFEAKWAGSVITYFPPNPNVPAGTTASADFSYTLDVKIGGLDMGRANGLFGTSLDGIKKFLASDPTFTRWQPLAFAPVISSQPLLVSDPTATIKVESLPLYWGNLNCAYSIAIHPDSNPDHNSTGNYYLPPDDSGQLYEDTQQNKGGYVITDANGDRLTLDSSFNPSGDIQSTFTNLGNGFTLSHAGPPGHIRERGTYTYTFDSYLPSDKLAPLTSIADDLGNKQTLVYGHGVANAPFLTVTDLTSNRQLLFYTSGNYVSRVVAPVLFGSMPVIQTILTNDGGGHYTDIVVYDGADTSFTTPVTESHYSYFGHTPYRIVQGKSTQVLDYINSPALDVANNVIPRVNSVTVGLQSDPSGAMQSVTQYQYGTIQQGYGFYGVDSRTNYVTDPNGNQTQIIYSYVDPIYNTDPEAIAGLVTTGPTFTGASGPNVVHEAWLPDMSHPTSYQVSDPLGRTWITTYDATTGLPTQISDPATNSYQLTYSGMDLQSITDPTSVQWNFGYDLAHPGDGLLTSVTDNAQNVVMTATYNQYGQLQTQTTPGSVSASGIDETITRTYDEATGTGDLLSVTDALGAQSLVGRIDATTRTLIPGSAYDAMGDPLAFLAFPDTGNPQTALQSLLTQLTWTTDQQVKTATLPNGLTLSHSYENGAKTQTQMLAPSGTLLAQSGVLYDTHGRVYQSSDLLGTTAQITYDKNSNVTLLQDGRGIGTSISYGPNKEVTTMAGAFGSHSFIYNAAGDLSQLTDSRNDVFHYGYDGLGRLQTISVDNHPEEARTYSYDIAGRLLSVTQGNGSTATFAYDSANKWLTNLSTSANGRTTNVGYSYYGDGTRQQMTVTTSTGHTYSTGYQWDAAGQLVGMDLPIGGHTAWTYDFTGRLTGQTTNTGSALLGTQYVYGSSGMPGDSTTAPAYLSQIVNTVNNAPLETFSLTHSYLSELLRYSQTANNGDSRSATYTYDARGRLTGEARQGAVGGQAYSAAANYTYDASDNLNAGANGWQYDGHNRLIGSPTNANGMPGTQGITYDADGHVATIAIPATYNSFGNVTANDVKTMTYNVWGQIATVTDQTVSAVPVCGVIPVSKGASENVLADPPIITSPGSTVTNYVATYSYDSLGRRATESVNNGSSVVTTFYDYDGTILIGQEVVTIAILHEFDGSCGPVTLSSLLSQRPIHQSIPSQTSCTFSTNVFARTADLGDPIDFATSVCRSNNATASLDELPDFALMPSLVNQQVGIGTGSTLPGNYTVFNLGPGGRFGSGVYSNGQFYYTYYDVLGNASAVVDSHGNVTWRAGQGADAFGNAYSSANLPPTPFVTNGGYRDATGAQSNAQNGLNSRYRPLIGDDDPEYNSAGDLYKQLWKEYQNRPEFQNGSPERRNYAAFIRQIPWAGPFYSGLAGGSGWDLIAGECEGIGPRMMDGFNAAGGAHELFMSYGGEGGGGSGGTNYSKAQIAAKETAVKKYLTGLGHAVTENPLEGAAGAGKQGDVFVDGVLHEIKSLDPGAVSGTIKNVVGKSIAGTGQARNMIFDARGSGLGLEDAQSGVYRAFGNARGKLDSIRVIGDGYDWIGYPR